MTLIVFNGDFALNFTIRNNTKYTKTKLPGFSRFLRHSARKQDGLILQSSWVHTGRHNSK